MIQTLPCPPPCLKVRIAGDPEGVRAAIARVRADFDGAGATSEALDTLELVLAEAMNNVVEHAFRDAPGHEILLTIGCSRGKILCQIVDDGYPMPGLELPKGQLPDVDVDMQELPEGGFGWFLIRQLTEALEYDHQDGTNRLSFRLALCSVGCEDCARMQE